MTENSTPDREPVIRVGYLYAIVDLLAQQIIGGVQVHKADAPAIRTFGDIATQQNSIIAMHPKDFSLVKIGELYSDHTIAAFSSPVTVIDGSSWLAAQTSNQEAGA